MSDKTRDPAIVRARRAWQTTSASVCSSAMRKHGTVSSWLKDHAGRPSRGVKGADQLARLSQEMADAGYSMDEIDRALIALVRTIAGSANGPRAA